MLYLQEHESPGPSFGRAGNEKFQQNDAHVPQPGNRGEEREEKEREEEGGGEGGNLAVLASSALHDAMLTGE